MLQDRLVLLGVAGLAAVATAGWMRTPAAVPAASMVNSFQPAPDLSLSPLQQPLPVSSVSYAMPEQQPVRVPAAPTAQSRTVTRVQRTPIAYDDRGVPAKTGRSTKASAAIIGGGAAAGAAIGAIAGGGKGAAIGALSGGAAGLVYDRMTHKKSSTEGYRAASASDKSGTGRSTLKTAAIIGGGAAAGAAIGGAAAGGKGAAIGALGGGAAGYVYDRITKN